tara:strand:- start:110 stop:586 length:477 start_codon:yes stop_codon:yes gene_type:complete
MNDLTQWPHNGLLPPAKPIVYTAVELHDAAKTTFILQVKSEADSLIDSVVGSRTSEYELAEKEATAYKAAGYPATPIPSSVQDEVDSKAAKGVVITATVACNNILTSATNWRNAQAALRNNRLTTVSATEVVVDSSDLDVLKAQWAGFMAALRLQVGV